MTMQLGIMFFGLAAIALTQKSAAPERRPLDCRVMPATTTENGNERTED